MNKSSLKKVPIEVSKDDKVDSKISFAIVFQICALITNYTIKHVLQINDSTMRTTVSFIFMIIVGLVFLKNLPSVFRRKGKELINIYLVSFIIFLFHMLIFPDNIYYLPEIGLYYFLINIPNFIYYMAIINKKIFFEMLVKSSYYQIALVLLFSITRFLLIKPYDMVYSYLALLPVTLLFNRYLNEKKLISLLLAICGLFSIIIIGSRGPLVSLIVFFVLFSMLNINIRSIKFKHIYFFLSIVLIIGLSVIYWDYIFEKLYLFFESKGIYSRTLYIIVNYNSIDFSAGRIPIYKNTINAIYSKPILGLGIGGDRYLLNGTYPHNIILEIFCNFGIIVGSFMIIYIFIKTMHRLSCKNTFPDKDLSIIYFCIGLVPLMFSGSYLTSTNFWIFLGIIMNKTNKTSYKEYLLCT